MYGDLFTFILLYLNFIKCVLIVKSLVLRFCFVGMCQINYNKRSLIIITNNIMYRAKLLKQVFLSLNFVFPKSLKLLFFEIGGSPFTLSITYQNRIVFYCKVVFFSLTEMQFTFQISSTEHVS